MSTFINENDKGRCSESELFALADTYAKEASLMFCVFTDRFFCKKYEQFDDIGTLLEIRVFDEQGEFKAIRGNIGKVFVWRYISDENLENSEQFDLENQCYDEIQYLDIDIAETEKITNANEYVSIGGGHYIMPEEGLEKTLIRHYGEYDSEGMLIMKDYRIVRFMKRGEGND